ncbi:MAG: hypothetical protein Sapg2KO_03560 [Saprospiraceae bacterium]
MSDQNKNPFLYFWDLATGGLLSASSDKELTPNNKAGKTNNGSNTKKVSKPLTSKTPKKTKKETSNNLKLEG